MPGARRIVMIGSAFGVRGGVSAMARVCASHGMFERRGVTYIATHCDGTARDKATQAVRAWLEFMGLLLRGRVALLHAHLNSDASFWRKSLFLLPAMLFAVPCVVQLHCGAFPEFYRDRCGPGARRFVRWLLRRARSVVALTEASQRSLAHIDPRLRVVVIPNPVEIPTWQAPVAEGPPLVLFLGMIAEAKGAFDLLRAWSVVRERVPGARLILAGAGDIARAQETVRSYGFAPDEVEMPGWVGDDAKAALLRRAWVLALPSHWEAMPMSLLEAMAAGVPVVATRVGGIPATVADGECGLLVESRNLNALAKALEHLLLTAESRRRLGNAARRRAIEHFSADVVVPRLEALWDAILSGPTHAGLAATRG